MTVAELREALGEFPDYLPVEMEVIVEFDDGDYDERNAEVTQAARAIMSVILR